jgi:hypothetical protein
MKRYMNNGEDGPIFIPERKQPIDFIPIGHEDEYTQDNQGNCWKKTDIDKMRI